ncbi:MucB/RseB C-terminal domain-containing protein [Shewanella sp. NIFS-20-20]|nr:MucB/RseB C-terminal domain-containing protein [Shewanella sp. NIFS-20-20]
MSSLVAQTTAQTGASADAAQTQPKELPQDAQVWLENMSQSLRKAQYKVSIIHLQANHIRPFVYLHGIVDGEQVAFLEYLNGPPMNAVRVGQTVTYIEHEQPAYSVHAGRIEGSWPAAFSGDINQLAKGYEFVLGGRSRIAGRPGQMIRLIPKDELRYSHQVWIDMESFLPLRYDLLSDNRDLIEQMLAIELLELPASAPLLEEAFRTEWPLVMNPPERADGQDWKFSWLPEGFRIVVKDHHRLLGSQQAVEYIALSDGLVDISVYVSRLGETPMPEELITRNGLSLVTELVGNAEVVVIGKAPSATLSRIAKSLHLE